MRPAARGDALTVQRRPRCRAALGRALCEWPAALNSRTNSALAWNTAKRRSNSCARKPAARGQRSSDVSILGAKERDAGAPHLVALAVRALELGQPVGEERAHARGRQAHVGGEVQRLRVAPQSEEEHAERRQASASGHPQELQLSDARRCASRGRAARRGGARRQSVLTCLLAAELRHRNRMRRRRAGGSQQERH